MPETSRDAHSFEMCHAEDVPVLWVTPVLVSLGRCSSSEVQNPVSIPGGRKKMSCIGVPDFTVFSEEMLSLHRAGFVSPHSLE